MFDHIVLCAHCMANNRPIDEFCHDCGMPIGQYVWNQPLQNAFAQGWAYRRASTGYVSPIVFWGMWAAFGPILLLIVISWMVMLTSFTADGGASFSFTRLFGALAIGGMTVLYVMLLIRVTRNYRRHRNVEHAT